MKSIKSFSFNSISIRGILLSVNIGEEPTGEKLSSDVEILLKSVQGAFRSRM
jgi:hypothetical protein